MKSVNASFTLEKSYRCYFLWLFLVAYSKLNMGTGKNKQSFTVIRIIHWEMWFSNVSTFNQRPSPMPVHETATA
jgi:hypothetical protein